MTERERHRREQQRLRSIAVAAEHADVTPRTVRRWVASGLLPAYRVGPRLLKVDLEDLDRMITRRVPTAGGDAA